jgi:hypothetical protein
MIPRSSFFKLFNSPFWKRLNDSVVPFDEPVVKVDFLTDLYDQIVRHTYSPSPPREYIVFNKQNHVPRYVPTFHRKDICVFYFCIKMLERELAVNRVPGTFGGWRMGNAIREREKDEILDASYTPINALNPRAWAEQWLKFQEILKLHTRNKDHTCFIKLDIANFYDAIDLAILEDRIRHAVGKGKHAIVGLLMHFLRNWNRHMQGYSSKQIGIPQDDIGDLSRILANFFLQQHDQKMRRNCKRFKAQYLRFADDQIFCAGSIDDCRALLVEASKSLHELNLNINSGKVIQFENREGFEQYWCFELFDSLSDITNQVQVNKAIDIYFDLVNRNVQFRRHSALKRLLNVDFSMLTRKRRITLEQYVLDPDFLTELKPFELKRIREIIGDDARVFRELDSIAENILFNSYLYNLIKLYSECRKDFDLSILYGYIQRLKF